MTNRVIIFAGLIRNENKFLSFLEFYQNKYSHLNTPFFLSTWAGEIEKYPKVKHLCDLLNIVICIQNQPNLRLPGHLLHQLLSVEVPLESTPSNAYVFRSRPDFAEPEFLDRFFNSEPTPISNGLLTHKIGIIGGLVSQPFYINDMTYYGIQSDLIQFLRMPITAPIHFFRMAPEQLLWGSFFASRIRFLFEYFRTNVGMIFNAPQKSAILNAALIENENFITALVIYFKIVEKYFICKTDALTNSDLPTETLEKILFQDVGYPGTYFHSTAFNNAFNDKTAINSVLGGIFLESDFGNKFNAKMTLVSNSNIDHVDHLFTFNPSADELFMDICMNQLEISGFKNISTSERHWSIKNNSAGWTLLDNSTASQHMGDEINRLRRLVEMQQKEISRLSK